MDSRYVCTALEEAQWREVTEAFKNSPNDGNLIGIEPYGGRITKIASCDTAFVHRTPGFNLYCWVMWLNEEEHGPAIAFLDGLLKILSKFSNGGANQNYPRRSNKNYRSMYWAGNYSTLLAIKLKYDPHNFFSYGHCVSLPAPSAGQKLLFDIDAPIVSIFPGGQ